MIDKIEQGKQLGIDKRICRENKYYWYSYAIQKKDDIYFVYECEIAEEKMAMEEYEYENINKYHFWDDVVKNFPGNYGIGFEDISALRGQRIFNVELYNEK